MRSSPARHTDWVLQTLGNMLAVAGVIVTLVSYFGQRRGVTLAELEPDWARRWNAARGWVRRRLGRAQTVKAVGGAVELSSATGSVSIVQWYDINLDDDIASQVDKLAKNVEWLRSNTEAERTQDRQRLLDLTDGLTQRINNVDQRITTHDEESRKVEILAMRWEVRGLLITLVGTLLSLVG